MQFSRCPVVVFPSAVSKRHFAATLDASGAASVEEVRPSRLGAFIDVLRRVVGLPFDNDPGRWLMGVVSALYALALISGVVVLLPSLVKDFAPGQALSLDPHAR